MKQYFKKIIIFSMSVILLFVSCPFSAYASDHGGSGGTDHNSDFITDSSTINVKDDGVVMYYIEYILSQIGAIVKDHDLTKAMANDQTMKEYISKGKFDANENTVTFPKETVTYVYNTFNNVAKEHEPYHMVETYPLNSIPMSNFANHKNVYDTLVNLLNESPSGVVLFGCSGGTMSSTNLGEWFTRISPVLIDNSHDNIEYVRFYQNENWDTFVLCIWTVTLAVDDSPIKTISEFVDKAGNHYIKSANSYACPVCTTHKTFKIGSPKDYSISASGSQYDTLFIISKDARRIRVFNTYGDFQNYTLGKRSVYYTNEYYNYVPEDLTTSIDDLQQTVDDLSGVIDQLLGQITDTTDESEIEDLLKQILDELKNNQGGGGGGGGSGGGDVNVDIDLSSTNTLLSKILATVTQIFDKISAGSAGTGGNILKESLDAVLAKLEDLNSMLRKYLSEITGDLDDIKGQLADMSEQEFEQKSDSFLGEVMDAFSEISEVVKTKFPFSIPNDLHIFLSKIAPAPPEAEAALYLNDTSGVSLYSGEHGGGGTTDGEPNPPGGGGASRPGSSFVDVEHGGGGGSREPAEMREAPVFRLPIVIERYGIEEYIIIDMAPFDPLSRFSRSFFTMIFMVCLFNLTFKVIGMWGDIVG